MKNTKNEKSNRKLHTKSETLRMLSGSDLEKAVGGLGQGTSTCNCNGSTC